MGASGDYNNLLCPPLPSAVVFGLDAGTNTVSGTFFTPDDLADTFLIDIGSLQTLTAIRVTFATIVDPFNPVAINHGSRFIFDLASSNQPTALVDLALTGSPNGSVLFTSDPLSLGAGLYNATILTEVRALNNAPFAVGYRVAFDVTAVPAVPEPASVAMMLSGIAMIGLWVRRRKSHLERSQVC